MESLLALLPAAGCAAVMFLCFRMMRHSGMSDDTPETNDEVVLLRGEVAALRDEVARTQPVITARSTRESRGE